MIERRKPEDWKARRSRIDNLQRCAACASKPHLVRAFISRHLWLSEWACPQSFSNHCFATLAFDITTKQVLSHSVTLLAHSCITYCVKPAGRIPETEPSIYCMPMSQFNYDQCFHGFGCASMLRVPAFVALYIMGTRVAVSCNKIDGGA